MTKPFMEKTALLTNGSYRNRAGGAKDITCIVLHQTCSGQLDNAMAIRNYFNGLRSPNRVSSHYVVGREKPRAVILQCVPDSMESYHAGSPSSWKGRANVNSFSIGIEVVDDGHHAADSWPDNQMLALAFLVRKLMRAHGLQWDDVTDHKAVLRTGERSDMTSDFPWWELKKYVETQPWDIVKPPVARSHYPALKRAMVAYAKAATPPIPLPPMVLSFAPTWGDAAKELARRVTRRIHADHPAVPFSTQPTPELYAMLCPKGK
jgi:N-acetyl-anhydromuramyl-L-alanine amidase AmpD